MANELTTFESNVKTRLNEIIADLIPQEKLDELIKKEVMYFENTELPKLVKKVLEEQYRVIIKAELEKTGCAKFEYDSSGNMLASKMVSQLIVELAPTILSNMIGYHVNMAVNQMRNSF